MKIRVAWLWQELPEEISVDVAHDTTVADALVALKKLSMTSLSNAMETRASIGVWGKSLNADEVIKTVLRENDRIELYRPLKADPKLARRQRVENKKQAKKSAR